MFCTDEQQVYSDCHYRCKTVQDWAETAICRMLAARLHSAILCYAMTALTTSAQHQKGILLAERVNQAGALQSHFIPAGDLA